jgi:hypothetical protein
MSETAPAPRRPRRGFRADYRVWTRGDAAAGLLVELLGDPPRGHRTGAGIDLSVEISVLYHPDGRFRMDWGPDTPTPGRVRVFDGERDWSDRADGHVTVTSWPTPALRGLFPPYERPGLRPVPGSEADEEIEGRRVHRIRLEREPDGAPGRHRSAESESAARTGARRSLVDIVDRQIPDAVELAVDDELGLALSERAFRDGVCVRGQELRRITVLDTFDDADFGYVPPPGAEIARLDRRADGRLRVDAPLSVKIQASAQVLRAAVRLVRRAGG